MKKKYIVGFSGGIDSTFVAWHLVQQGHEVRLVHLKNTTTPNKCCKIPTELFSQSHILGIPLQIVDVTEKFRDEIIGDFVASYKNGLTPNPCIRCNEKVRRLALEATRQEIGYDYIATGHYAQLVQIDGEQHLGMALDGFKDQTYMLYRISYLRNPQGERILNHVRFPLAGWLKDDVKAACKKNNLPVLTDKESQNICFVPDDDYSGFISRANPAVVQPGPIIDHEGNHIAEHNGIINYTIGQRRGIGISLPVGRFVIRIDARTNTVVVGPEQLLYTTQIDVTEFFADESLAQRDELLGRIRYRAGLSPVSSRSQDDTQPNKWTISFDEPQRASTPGQHAVLYTPYQGEAVVVGGGIII